MSYKRQHGRKESAIAPPNASLSDNVYYTKFPSPLMPVDPSLEELEQKFESKVDKTLQTPAVAFVEQLTSHTVHGLPEMMVKQTMSHNMTEKYLTMGGRGEKKEQPSLLGPKRSKYRKLMSSRQRKANGFDKLSADHEQYELYAPLHDLWKQYMVTLKTSKLQDKAQRFARSDWHGAVIQVTKSCVPGLVGTKGIILQETSNCFKIITPLNRYRFIPKKNTVFAILMDEKTVATIYGNHILYRSTERSSRKFKAKQTIDIAT